MTDELVSNLWFVATSGETVLLRVGTNMTITVQLSKRFLLSMIAAMESLEEEEEK